MAKTVVLVDEKDKRFGVEEIFSAHKNPGKLHRAVSVVLWRDRNGKKEVLLQKRSEIKPLWPGYWANTCCTHPEDDESYLDCSVRRLKEEMGIRIVKSQLRELYRYKYQADYNSELSEHELDTVVVGNWDGEYEINRDEVAVANWVKWEWLIKDVEKNMHLYTPWVRMIVTDKRVGDVLYG